MSITIDQIPEADLSPRQREVVALLAAGQTNREIAARLGTGVKTIDTHRGAAIKRLGVRNNADLTRYAIAAGLIENPQADRVAQLEAAVGLAARLVTNLVDAMIDMGEDAEDLEDQREIVKEWCALVPTVPETAEAMRALREDSAPVLVGSQVSPDLDECSDAEILAQAEAVGS